ncbi:MAG: hypothetical protein COC19_03955 [SAR86 cluster bacterium]|uniref:DUF2170 domain-containing protein n=1 Tax=SAR86 cluster bacterium TaxID=2030880 RepID=A0A2A4MP33_9GAMM|nr:MAG: hypothetical protein COC19_03955 [SAR86 cluster bacterium]
MNLEDLTYQLNDYTDPSGADFVAQLATDQETLTVTCSINPDASIILLVSDEQIISVTPLLRKEDIQTADLAEFNQTVLRLSPVIPLSSIGLQDDGTYILFGAMSVNTSFENIAHELAIQADNASDVLAALDSFVSSTSTLETV